MADANTTRALDAILERHYAIFAARENADQQVADILADVSAALASAPDAARQAEELAEAKAQADRWASLAYKNTHELADEVVALRADAARQAEALRVARRFVVETETDAERARENEPLSLWRGGVLKEIDAALAAAAGDTSEEPRLPCGHPESAVAGDAAEGTFYCGECARVSS